MAATMLFTQSLFGIVTISHTHTHTTAQTDRTKECLYVVIDIKGGYDFVVGHSD